MRHLRISVCQFIRGSRHRRISEERSKPKRQTVAITGEGAKYLPIRNIPFSPRKAGVFGVQLSPWQFVTRRISMKPPIVLIVRGPISGPVDQYSMRTTDVYRRYRTGSFVRLAFPRLATAAATSISEGSVGEPGTNGNKANSVGDGRGIQLIARLAPCVTPGNFCCSSLLRTREDYFSSSSALRPPPSALVLVLLTS